MHEMTLANLGGGALLERFDDELEKLLENVFDRNTPYNTKRKIVVAVVFEPNEDRDAVRITYQVESRLSPPKACMTEARIGVGPEGPVIREAVQLPLFEPEERDPKVVLDMPPSAAKER